MTPQVLGTFAGEAGSLYEHSLLGLIAVLEAAGETHWLAWVRRSLEEWRISGSAEGHRRAYGGMGSLNDLVLTQPGTDVAMASWLDAALWDLRDSAYRFSSGAETNPDQFRQGSVPSGSLDLHWYRCRSCGSGFTTTWNVYNAAAQGWASYAVPRLVSARRGADIAAAARGEVPEFLTQPYVEHIERRYEQLGVKQADIGRHWESPCPSCGAIDWWYTSAAAF